MADLKSLARQVFLDTLRGLDIPAATRAKLRSLPGGGETRGDCIAVGGEQIDLARFKRIGVIAIGKAAIPMTRGFLDVIGHSRCSGGIVVTPKDAWPAEDGAAVVDHGRDLRELPGMRVITASHPAPDEDSFRAGREILDYLTWFDGDSLVVFLLSGGGSSLVELPIDASVTLEDTRHLYHLLVGCGAPIAEINAVRKHFSAVKGGRLAAAAPRATKITLAVTDVPVGHESALASGPTIPDPTTVNDACAVILRNGLSAKLPQSICDLLARPSAIPETLKPGDPAFANSHFEILLGMHDLFHHAHHATESRGWITVCDDLTDDWPLDKAADHLILQAVRLKNENPNRCVAVIADGEVRSPVLGDGVGGRNSAFVLECVPMIAGTKVTVLSCGTDGRDGSSPAAGAVADGTTLQRAEAARLDYRDFARRSDSYHFFKALGDAVETGPTGNNLRDLRLILME